MIVTNQQQLKKPLLNSGFYTVLLTLIFLLFSWGSNPVKDIFIALPFFVIFYFLICSIGKPHIADFLNAKTKEKKHLTLILPLAFIVLYFGYLGLNGENPFQGILFLVPYLLFFPVLAFALYGGAERQLGWFDFMVFFLYFLPVTLIHAKPAGNLPIRGGGFDSVYRIIVILTAVYAFVSVRNLRDVGFFPVFKWQNLFTVIWVWLLFYASVFVIGWSVNFITFKQDSAFHILVNQKVFRTLVSIFLHTALFEELVFRGLLQNMISKRIRQSNGWKSFWIWWLIILLMLSLLIGYALKGNMHWFPALITLILFLCAWLIESWKKNPAGAYTSLAITSVIFGLVHAHTGSIIFVGLASIGGWAYGYVYHKTTNVFYAALLHALVNATPLIFGLELAK